MDGTNGQALSDYQKLTARLNALEIAVMSLLPLHDLPRDPLADIANDPMFAGFESGFRDEVLSHLRRLLDVRRR